ncbi:MAG: aldehyde dehydrogenase [Myxococcaceae bacterium]|nr:aldehyde dehydrogenase [Myxococcaceae bacterium]
MSAAQQLAPTPFEQLDDVMKRVKDGSRAFVKLSIDERIALAKQMRQGYREVAEASVRAACEAKGIPFDSPLSGEEWLAGPMVTIRNLRLLCESLEQIKTHGVPRIDPSWIRTLPDGRIAVRVYPANGMEGMLLAKHTAEVYMQPGVTAENLKDHQASFYKNPHGGRLCVVLGAGNVNSIPPTDAVYKMFVEGTVCVLKMNPVNEYLGPLIERAFKLAIDRGFFAVVYGGADVGRYLVEHPLTDEVHITGSDKTHDLMVWGPPGPERDARKQRNEPLLKKEITSELGNVTPVIVVPGPWSDSELQFQADNIAGMVLNNASFNCNAAKLLTVPKSWPLRGRLLDLVEQSLRKGHVRKAYYPGAEERWKQFTEGRAGVRLVGNPKQGELAWAIIPDVDPANADDCVFNQEPWCAILSETAVEGDDAPTFLDRAVKFVNERVWGTLAVSLIVHPKTQTEHGEAVEKAIRDLRYGSVVVNTWAGAVFGLGSTPWGGHPSSTLQNIQSGRGWVHNTYMLEGIEKCVLRAPHKASPISPWFPGHRTVHKLAQKLCDFEMAPSWLKIPGIASTALRA